MIYKHGKPFMLIAVVFIALVILPGFAEPSEGLFEVNAMNSPAAVDSAEPHMALGQDGTVVLSWLEHGRDTATLRYSVLDGDRWRAAETVFSGDDWFVNWADFPSVVPITSNLWAAHWLAKRPGGRAP